MEIVIYRKKNVAVEFEEALRASFSQVTAYTSVESFCTRLRHTPSQGALLVLAAADVQELTKLMSFRHLMEDAPKILIVPIRESVLLAKAHKLHPRFIGDLDRGAGEVIAVIHNMLTRMGPPLKAAPAGSTEKLTKGIVNG